VEKIDHYFSLIVNFKSEEDISVQVGHIIVKCVGTKAGLWKQLQEVVVICEKEKITHLNILCSKGECFFKDLC
jgi:hypothetical protein